jgi:hypothetical protein
LAAVQHDANITQGEGQGNGTGWMDSLDPLFSRIADAWMEGMLATFGKTGSWYQADGFFHNGTSWGRPAPEASAAASSPAGRARLQAFASASSVTCTWSAAVPDTFLAGCDPTLGCGVFRSLGAAQASCAASQTCFGVTEHAPGAFEPRGTSTPSRSPSNETSFVILNAGTCHAPAPDPAWAARGAAAYAGLARTDPDAVWSFQGYALEVGGGPGAPGRESLARLRGFVDGAPPGHFVIGAPYSAWAFVRAKCVR